MVKNFQSQFLADNINFAFVVRTKEIAKEINEFITSTMNQGWTRKNEDSNDNGIDYLLGLDINIDSIIDLDLLERASKNLEEIADVVERGIDKKT